MLFARFFPDDTLRAEAMAEEPCGELRKLPLCSVHWPDRVQFQTTESRMHTQNGVIARDSVGPEHAD